MKQKQDEKNQLTKILKYFNNVKSLLIIFTILMIICSLLSVINPIVSANMLTSLADFNIESAIILSLIIFSLAIFKDIINRFIDIIMNRINCNIMLNIRKDMIKNVFGMKISNFDNHTSGEFSERLKNDPENIISILNVVQYSLLSMIADICVLIYIVFLNWIIGLLYLICVFIIYYYEKISFKKYEKNIDEKNKSIDRTSTLLNEIIRGIRDIKYLNIGSKLFPMVSNNLKESTKKQYEVDMKLHAIYQVIDAIQNFFLIIIIIFGIFLVKNNLLTINSLLVIFMYKSNIFDLTLCYTSIKDYWAKFKSSTSRIFELMDNQKFEKETFGKKKYKNAKGKIEIKDLSFAYKEKKVLGNINLTVMPNDTIGIVGHSGSGKSTLLNLLSKGYNVDDNKIFIDDIDINELDRDSIRNNISFITQSPYIFNLSIKENLKLMGTNVSEKEMKEACRLAQIDEFIEGLPDKYDTLLGEGGMNLSGGQKQRLAIARALIKKSKIIIFDEATSALDNITQAELQKSINNITKDYTIIIVAHRLSTIKDCNKIYVLNDGKIVGSGIHDELLKENKYYKKLYESEISTKK